jgi:serine/threonine protein phosphatase 1
MSVLSRLFGKSTVQPKRPPSTGGRLVYAVGDVHGRLDLLEPLLKDVVTDMLRSRPARPPLLVFLGDYVDRGDSSAGVIDLILRLKASDGFEVVTLKGNHEEALLQFMEDPDFGVTWMVHGGATTLASYKVTPPTVRNDPEVWRKTSAAFAKALPSAHLEFLQNLELMVTIGDYAFVHAGVRPGAALNMQEEHDLLWIRQDFLQASGPFEKIIVHGHTPAEEPQLTPHRLGLDTGAYATGVLTAVRLDDDSQRILQARARRPQAA